MKTKTIKVVKRVPTAISAKETPKVKKCTCSGDCGKPTPEDSVTYDVKLVEKERVALSMLSSIETVANDIWVALGDLEGHLSGYLSHDHQSNGESVVDTPPHSAFTNRLEALRNSLVLTGKRLASLRADLEI